MTKKIYIPNFEKIGHKYTTPEGLPLISVTTVMKYELDLYHYNCNDAAQRGTYVHELTEDYDKGILDPLSNVSDELVPYLNAYKLAKSELGFEVLEVEQMLYHPIYMYAGALDRIIKIGNTTYIMDIKSGAEENWHPSQVAAYRELRQYSYGGTENYKLADLYLHKDGTYTFKVVNATMDTNALHYFLSLLYAHNVKVALGYRK